ncbi:MAG: hypothetical protein ACLUD9_01955 [Anaerotignum faecicola]
MQGGNALPQCIETRAFTLDGERIELTAVVFAGITHILVPVSLWGENAEKGRTRQGSGRRSCRLCLGFCCLMRRRKA